MASSDSSPRLPPRGHASVFLPALLTDEQSAEYLGISARKFHELRSEPWMPTAIVLGPRLVRWSRAELDEAVLKMPRQEAAAGEPEQLQRSRETRRVIVKNGRISKVLPT